MAKQGAFFGRLFFCRSPGLAAAWRWWRGAARWRGTCRRGRRAVRRGGAGRWRGGGVRRWRGGRGRSIGRRRGWRHGGGRRRGGRGILALVAAGQQRAYHRAAEDNFADGNQWCRHDFPFRLTTCGRIPCRFRTRLASLAKIRVGRRPQVHAIYKSTQIVRQRRVLCLRQRQRGIQSRRPGQNVLAGRVYLLLYLLLTFDTSTCQSTPDSIWCLAAKSPWLMATATSSRLFR